MKFRHLFLMGMIVIGACYALVPDSPLHIEVAEVVAVGANREDANRQTTTRLDDEEWVEFQLKANSTTLRLLTNAALEEDCQRVESQSDPRTGWRYAVDYQLLNVDREIVRESEYHFRSHVRQLIDSDDGSIINPLVFGHSGYIATQTRLMQVPLNGEEAILRVRVASTDAEIEEVVARVSSRVERDEFWKRSTWNRVSYNSKERLSRFCVYNHQLLSDAERANLLRWQWVQSPTLGEFENRFLYFIGEIEDQQTGDEPLPEGCYIEPGWLSTIPVPSEPGRMRLTIERVALDGPSPAEIEMLVAGPEIQQRETFQHRFDTDIGEYELTVDHGGLVEFQTSEPVVIRAYWSAIQGESILAQDAVFVPLSSQGGRALNNLPGQEITEYEITPDPSFVRTYLADDRAVVFPVSHIDNKSTPFRATVRIGLDNTFRKIVDTSQIASLKLIDGPVPYTFHWNYLNEAGEVVSSGSSVVELEKSRYDRMWKSGKTFLVTDPIDVYFSVPTDACAIRFICESAPLLVSGCVRPAGMTAEVRVPEDYRAFEKVTSPARRWFILKPLKHLELLAENRSFVLRTHARPNEVDPEILAGNYDWLHFEPQGRWIGRQMLVPANTMTEIRNEAVDVTFFEVQSGEQVEINPFEGRLLTSPRVIFTGSQSPGRIRVSHNGDLILDQRIVSSRGEIDLEIPVANSGGSLKVESDNPTRLFVSGFDIDSETRFLKRTAARLQDGRLRFNYTKTTNEEELVTLLVYREDKEEDRCKLHVTVRESDTQPVNSSELAFNEPVANSISTFESWTIRDRVFDLRAIDEDPSVMLDVNAAVDSGHRCFVKLGTDLPPGNYEITASRIGEQSGGYVLLYQTRPGRSPSRDIKIRKSAVQP